MSVSYAPVIKSRNIILVFFPRHLVVCHSISVHGFIFIAAIVHVLDNLMNSSSESLVDASRYFNFLRLVSVGNHLIYFVRK